MARWRLTEKHYLYTEPPTYWEQVETDLETGEQVRHRHVVPLFLNPEDPKFRNKNGDVVVCQGKKEDPRDIIFIGTPTMYMAPIDEEAQAISDATPHGEHPINSLPANGTDQPDVIRQMQAQINTLMLANDELQRRAAQATGDAAVDMKALGAQAPKINQPSPPRRL